MRESIEWVDKRSSRIWRGRMESRYWRYIKGSGEPGGCGSAGKGLGRVQWLGAAAEQWRPD